jgi:hypothetical protein
MEGSRWTPRRINHSNGSNFGNGELLGRQIPINHGHLTSLALLCGMVLHYPVDREVVDTALSVDYLWVSFPFRLRPQIL